MGLGGLCDFESLNLKWFEGELQFSSNSFTGVVPLHQVRGFQILIGISQANGCLTFPALSLNDTKNKAIFFFRFLEHL